MAEKIATLSSNGSTPVVEITIGKAQFGKYELYTWDQQGLNPKLIGSGLNTDQIPDIFQIGMSAAALEECLLSWQCIVSALSTGPGQEYAVSIKLTQDQVLIPITVGGKQINNPYVQKGPLTGTKIVHDYVRFKVQ